MQMQPSSESAVPLPEVQLIMVFRNGRKLRKHGNHGNRDCHQMP